MLSAVGRKGEDKFDGILDEIAAAAEAEDREFAMNQGIGLLVACFRCFTVGPCLSS